MTDGARRIVFFGSGAFGLPTLARLVGDHEVALVVTQPDRPSGRGRSLASTPVGTWAEERGIPVLRAPSTQAEEVMRAIHAVDADAYVVIAFGQKLRPALLRDTFSINLHGSLLPRHRGAAPVNWAILAGDAVTGVSVITLAERMDAGAILAERSTPIDPRETADELHDRLALLGPDVVVSTLEAQRGGTLQPRVQDESAVTVAPKLGRVDAWLRFDSPADTVRRRIHGLSPWPGCAVRVGEIELKLLRVEAIVDQRGDAAEVKASALGGAGTIAPDGSITCDDGAIRLIEVQPVGGRPMSFTEFLRGRRWSPGSLVESVVVPPQR